VLMQHLACNKLLTLVHANEPDFVMNEKKMEKYPYTAKSRW
jgi:hypothetical protein